MTLEKIAGIPIIDYDKNFWQLKTDDSDKSLVFALKNKFRFKKVEGLDHSYYLIYIPKSFLGATIEDIDNNIKLFNI